MPPSMYLASGALVKACEIALPFRIRVSGVENLVNRPTLFVSNHFTRFETLLVPYALYGATRMQVRTLANHFLFRGLMGRYLRACHVMSTRDPNRNDTIVGELMTGAINWVIYPEGGLVKSKKVVQGRRLHLDLPHREGPPRTGAAVMALTAEVYKRRYIKALEKGDQSRAAEIGARFGFDSADDLALDGTVIIPVTVTYWPIINDRTLLVRLIERLRGPLSPKLAEELSIESSLLFRPTEIGIHFGEPIEVRDHLDLPLGAIRQFASRNRRIIDDPMLKHRARRLTERLMRGIYENVEINLEHLFCTALTCARSDRISRLDLHAAIYLAGRQTLELENVRTHPALEAGLESLVTMSDPIPLRRIVGLATREGVLRVDGHEYVIDRSALMDDEIDFHRLRLLRLTRVLANEVEPRADVVGFVRRAVEQAEGKRRARVARLLEKEDQSAFDAAYDRWQAPGVSRSREIGQPYTLNGNRSQTGVVLVHGYLACPPEMDTIARTLHDQGHNVYVARLEGHGTAPEHLEQVRWSEWFDSLRRAYGVMRHRCNRVLVGGFSLGGVLALHLAGEQDPALAGVFTVNAPMRLRDRRAPLAGMLVGWNRLAMALRLTRQFATRSNRSSESPDINYLTNHLRGVVELRRAVRSCRRALDRVHCPLLVIQSEQDPVVHPDSARMIMSGVSSEDREQLLLEADRHVVIRSEAPEEMILRIAEFSHRLLTQGTPSVPRKRRRWPWRRWTARSRERETP